HGWWSARSTIQRRPLRRSQRCSKFKQNRRESRCLAVSNLIAQSRTHMRALEYVTLAGLSNGSLIGKIVSIKGKHSLFIITGVSYDVLKQSNVAHLRRIQPPPLEFVNPVALERLSEAGLPFTGQKADGLTLLVAKTIEAENPTRTSVFLARTQ